MSHPLQKRYCESLKVKFPQYFKNKRVLDIGSLDINGNNKYLFENCEYIGLDIIKGNNVDVVSIAHEYDEPDESFDTVLSTNTLEHDIYFPLTLKKMVKLLKSGGLMFFSVSYLWKEHGTLRTSPSLSATALMGKEWQNYYKNLTPKDIRQALDIDKIFKEYELQTEQYDTQFWGVKL